MWGAEGYEGRGGFNERVRQEWDDSFIFFEKNKQIILIAPTKPKFRESEDENLNSNSISEECVQTWAENSPVYKGFTPQQHQWWCVVYFMLLFWSCPLHFPLALQRFRPQVCFITTPPQPHIHPTAGTMTFSIIFPHSLMFHSCCILSVPSLLFLALWVVTSTKIIWIQAIFKGVTEIWGKQKKTWKSLTNLTNPNRHFYAYLGENMSRACCMHLLFYFNFKWIYVPSGFINSCLIVCVKISVSNKCKYAHSLWGESEWWLHH